MALLIGLSIGLIGGGGSILAVPVLAYLFHLDEKVATAYSLFIVGAAALVGGAKQAINGNVDWKTVFVFGLPSIIGVWLVRHYVVGSLPNVLFSIGDFDFTRRMAMFGLFSVLMVMAAVSMLSDKEWKGSDGEINFNYPLIMVEGLVVGSLTGFVGAGGGFLIIPALIIFAKLEVRKAIASSLLIIAFKSLFGFFAGDALRMEVDWAFLGIFSGLTFIGVFLGIYIGQFIDGVKLKKGFGYFVIVMAVFIFFMEFIVDIN